MNVSNSQPCYCIVLYLYIYKILFLLYHHMFIFSILCSLKCILLIFTSLVFFKHLKRTVNPVQFNICAFYFNWYCVIQSLIRLARPVRNFSHFFKPYVGWRVVSLLACLRSETEIVIQSILQCKYLFIVRKIVHFIYFFSISTWKHFEWNQKSSKFGNHLKPNRKTSVII